MTDAFIVAAAVERGETADPGTAALQQVLAISPAARRKIDCLLWGGGTLDLPDGVSWPRIDLDCGSVSGQQAVQMAVQGILAEDMAGAVVGAAGSAAAWDAEAWTGRVRWAEGWAAAQSLEMAELEDFSRRYAPQPVDAPAWGVWPAKLPANSLIPDAPGAAALVLFSAEGIGSLNLAPRGRLAGRALAAGSPQALWTATRQALRRAGISAADLALAAVVAPFSGVALGWLRTFEFSETRLLPAAPLAGAASGALELVRVLERLEDQGGQYGLVASLGQDGRAAASVIERI